MFSITRRGLLCSLLPFVVCLTVAVSLSAASDFKPVGYHGDYDVEFFPGGTYLPDVPTPSTVLGFKVGSQPATHRQVVEYFEQLAKASDRVILKSHGQTYEGRKLIHAIISSPENLARLDEIKNQIGKLADPRRLANAADADAIIRDNPTVFWIGYTIHGDELSGTDAGIQTAYQLAAGTDTLTEQILQNVVVILDPLENPDGRDRILAQLRSLNCVVPNGDSRSLQHSGFWPWGRTNHYLFDMNRDYYAVVHPETKGRIETIIEWHPQVVVDAHEMGSLDNFLFSPPREPFHPNMTENLKKWWDVFAVDQAAAFDRYGWRYYTGDWHEEWFPGFTSSWAVYTGAVGILYEQARVAGSQVKQRDDLILTYGETVHHQFISSIANMRTAAAHREDLLRGYYRDKTASVSAKPASFVIIPDENTDRLNCFLSSMQTQGVEVKKAARSFAASAKSFWSNTRVNKRFPEGTVVIPVNQPQKNLVEAILGFDHRMPDSALNEERRYLAKFGYSRMYEISAWSPLLAYDFDAYRIEGKLGVSLEPLTSLDSPAGRVHGDNAVQGYVMRTQADHELSALIELLDRELVLRAARKDFVTGGQSFARGSVVISRHGNPDNYRVILDSIAEKTGTEFFPIRTGLSSTGPDMGSGEYRLLVKPGIALAAGQPTDYTSTGSIWHLLDQRLGIKHSLLDVSRLGFTDLDAYNVLILPNVWGGPSGYERTFGKGGIAKLREWVKAGGTLIAIGAGAAFCADTTVKISQVRQRRQVLGKLEEYEKALKKERAAEHPDITRLNLWEAPTGKKDKEKAGGAPPKIEELEDIDKDARLYGPRGAILRVDLDDEEWLTFGMNEKVPAILYSKFALMSKRPVRTVGRFGNEHTMRLSGLLWPEARERWANTAYCTRESMGKGQVILIAGAPTFRAYFRGTERLLINAMLFGPGLGARTPAPW